jgi:hypothetical protein
MRAVLSLRMILDGSAYSLLGIGRERSLVAHTPRRLTWTLVFALVLATPIATACSPQRSAPVQRGASAAAREAAVRRGVTEYLAALDEPSGHDASTVAGRVITVPEARAEAFGRYASARITDLQVVSVRFLSAQGSPPSWIAVVVVHPQPAAAGTGFSVTLNGSFESTPERVVIYSAVAEPAAQ